MSTTKSVITVENSEHFAAWVEELRTTTHGQVQNTLVDGNAPETARFCCLGVGALCAGIPLVMDTDHWGFEYRTQEGEVYYADTMPPITFHEWLGITVSDVTTNDVTIDWPDDDYFVNRERLDEDYGVMSFYCEDEETATASSLNDRCGLTFAQIADVLAYFGVRGNQ